MNSLNKATIMLLILPLLTDCKERVVEKSSLKVRNGQVRKANWLVKTKRLLQNPKNHNEKDYYDCTGTLLCKSLVLTAGHCLEEYKEHNVDHNVLISIERGTEKKYNSKKVYMSEKAIFSYFGNELHDWFALLKITDEDYELNEITEYPKIADSRKWSNKPLASATINGFSGNPAQFPKAGKMRVVEYFEGNFGSEKVENLWIGLGLETVGHHQDVVAGARHTYETHQFGESGDSGGPVTLSFFSKYILGIHSQGLEFTRNLSNKQIKEKWQNPEIKEYPVNFILNLSIDPLRKIINENIQKYCDE